MYFTVQVKDESIVFRFSNQREGNCNAYNIEIIESLGIVVGLIDDGLIPKDSIF